MNDNYSSRDISNNFTETGNAQTKPISYAHPESASILSKARDDLAKSATGLRLLQMADQRNIEIHILVNKDITRFVPDSGHIYLGLSPDNEPDERHIVLNLGGALREAEHFLVGYAPPDPENSDPTDFVALSFAKELDIIINICMVAEELHASSALQNMIDVLEDMGHGQIYQSYREQKSAEEMLGMMIPERFGREKYD